jgi:transposase
MLTLNYTYRLYPDENQVELLNEWLETCRNAYNYALRELKDWIASRKCSIDRCSLESEYIMSADYPFPGYQQQQNNWEHPSLADIPEQARYRLLKGQSRSSQRRDRKQEKSCPHKQSPKGFLQEHVGIVLDAIANKKSLVHISNHPRAFFKSM